jgi:hypothetical protein
MQVVRMVAEIYAEDPSKTLEEAQKLLRRGSEDDPLRDFAEACRAELDAAVLIAERGACLAEGRQWADECLWQSP